MRNAKNLRVTTPWYNKLGQRNRRRGNGACRSDPVWPTGTQYNARSTFARFCTFVFLPSPNSIIFAKRGEYIRVQMEYKNLWETTSRAVQKRVQTEHTRIQRNTNGVQKPEGANIPSGTKNKRGTNGEQTRSTNGVQKNTSKLYKRSTNVQTEYKNLRDTTSLVQQIRTEQPAPRQRRVP